MKNLFLKTIVFCLVLLALPMKQHGQQPNIAHHKATIDFDITEISIFDERIFFMYNLVNDGRFNVVNSENDGVFIISADPVYKDIDLQAAFDDFRKENATLFAEMDKDQASATAIEYKSLLPKEHIHSLMMDVYIQSRTNNLCANADPFCTDNGLYQFPAGVNAGSGESGPNYNCLSTKPNPAWYYMRIGTPGSITINMYSTPSYDIDFCCWGPFEDPVAPCPYGLTAAKVVSCSYSTSANENCQIPSSAQTGQYYILVITNYSNHECNISFSKTSGNGTTDCGIMPPVVNNDGPYCVGDVIHLTANGQAGASYSWSGPNNYNSNQQNPTISNCNMTHTGSYTCTITVGSQTNNASTQVTVYAKPTANFTANAVCLGSATQFTNTSTTTPSNQTMTYLWDFGDGQTATQASPTHQFATAGNHTVTLIVSCGNGSCTSTKTQTVTVYAPPVANAGPDQTVIYGATATLSGSGGSGTFNYHWEPANKVVNPNAQTTQTVELEQSTTFTLTVTHPQGGCTSTDQVSILVEGSNMTATASASPNSICLGESSQLNANAVGGTHNYTYSWTPALGLNNPGIANPIATPSATTTYTCQVSDGMSTQNVTTTVTVNQPEHDYVDQYICPGETYNFYGQDYTEAGDYDYYTTTAQGCEKIITLHLHHYPSYPNASTTQADICPGYSYPFHGQYFNTSGMHSVNLHTTLGCDSIVWLDLNVYPANDTIIDPQRICRYQTLTWMDGNVYSQNGATAYYDSVDYHDCLQVYKLELTVGDYQTPENYNPNKYVCVPYDETPYYHWDKANRDYYQDTRDTIIVDGTPCDTMFTLNLKFHQEQLFTDTVVECDFYRWDVDGKPYTSTNHHISYSKYTEFGPNNSCHDTYILDLTINNSNESEVTVPNQCDQYEWQFGWNNENYLLTEQGNYTKTIDTYLGCDSTVTLKLQLDYSPEFRRVEGNPWVVGGSEFQYTIENYWIETHPKSTHSTEWELYDPNGEPFNKWELKPYDNGDKCLLYIYTFERDSIELRVHTQSTGECECGEYTRSKWIHCGYQEVPETASLCSAEIYPNPNDGNMTLSIDNMMGEVEVKVYSITGTLVDRFHLYNGYGHQTHSYQADRLSKGIYFFHFTGRRGHVTKKVVIFD